MRRLLMPIVVALSCLFSAIAVSAEVTLNPIFTDNAVLQRGVEVPVWGTAVGDVLVTVSIQGQSETTVAKGGEWMVRLRPLEAGGPFTLTVKADNTIELKNILVGEVWVASGQSNMAWPLSQTRHSEDVIAASADPMLRLFTVGGNPKDVPQGEARGGPWVEAKPETTDGFSAVGYYFGRDLRKALGVPVGIICSAVGGTFVEAWTPGDVVVMDEPIKEQLPGLGAHAAYNQPSVLYNGMISPLVPYAIKGAIWYQGESNAEDAYQYRQRFATMIESWRKAWGEGEFPFLFVQLAPYGSNSPESYSWAELRESQLYVREHLPNTGMAVIMDCGDAKDIHPRNKEPVGARLALAARSIAYGEKLVYEGPLYETMQRRGNRAVIKFKASTLGGGLEARDGALRGFSMAGEDRVFHPAEAWLNIAGDRVIVSSPEVKAPVAVRYGWTNAPDLNLFNEVGLPASSFRTDDWPAKTAPHQAGK